MNRIKELTSAITQLETDIICQQNMLDNRYGDVEEGAYGNYYYNPYPNGYPRQLTNNEVDEYNQDCNCYLEMCDELDYLKELKYQVVEHQIKMLKICAKIKTFVEVKSLQNSDILNDDVNTIIAGYLTGISNKPIRKQLRLF